MKKLLLLLLLAPLCVAQTTHTFGALDTNNVWTGNDTFLRLVPGHGTIAHLPLLPLPWMVFIVTDGTGPGDCSQGGGTDKHWCGYNDVLSAWVALGGGGGGGGGTPCGTLYDVQLNQPTGFFGCDTGIFQHNTVTHVTSTQTMQATQEVDVSDSTHNGLVDWGFSNGSTILAHFKLGLGASYDITGGGYGLNVPNAPIINKPLCITSLTPDGNGLLPTNWCPAATGAVSLEYSYPLDYTNAPSPTTSNDLIRTPFVQQPLTKLSGPKLPTDPTSSVLQDGVCTTGDAVTCQNQTMVGACNVSGSDLICTYTPGSPINPNDTLYVEATALCGLGCVGVTFGIADTNSAGVPDTFTQMVDLDGSGSTGPSTSYYTHAHGGITTVTITFHVGGRNYAGYFHMAVLRGPVVPDQFAVNSSIVGPVTIQPVTTGNPTDTLLITYMLQGGSSCTFTPGTGYGFIDLGNGTAYGTNLHIAAAAKNVSSTGTYTPDMTSSCSGAAGTAFTTAFTTDVIGGPAQPDFRLTTLQDLAYLGGPLPDPTGHTGLAVLSDGMQYVLGTVGAGTVTLVSGTTNQVNVATGTTTPVISLSSTLLLPGTLTMGAHAADFNAATLFTVPVSAGATSSANGVIAYDTTAKSFHFRVNNADAIGAAFASAPGGSKCLHTNGVTGLITESAADCGAGTPIATDSTQGTIETKTCTNQFFRAIVSGTGIPTCASIVAADLPTDIRTRSCEVVWGGTDTGNALKSGDDAIANQSCFNKIGVTETITGVYCRSDAGSNTTTVNPTFGTSGTGTTICSGALTCGSSGAYSATCTVSNGALTDGSNIDPAMAGTLTGTSIHMLVTYTLP